MKVRNIFLLVCLIIAQGVQAATFTLYNFSGRDIFACPFEWEQDKYVKIPAGQKVYFNSGIKSVKNIAWITDVPGRDAWQGYTTNGLELNALSTGKEFRVYSEGKYEENFTFLLWEPADNIRTAYKMDAPDSILVNGLGVNVTGRYAALLTIENNTNSVALIRPPVKQIFKNERGFVLNEYDCIAPGGSKIYYIGLNNALNVVEYVSCDETSKKWYGCMRDVGMPLVAGKIKILGNGQFEYILSSKNKSFTYEPTSKHVVAPPVDCKLVQ